ncbi:MauE/DoxX family redox-associated membrane protein [Streptomyces sp. NPDC047985]|uniref:MauE/DoxX family redox-associated membrane protein n=1 Tax=unclassified Streptomyces TaxID=2593676 RepID=UPI0034495FDA
MELLSATCHAVLTLVLGAAFLGKVRDAAAFDAFAEATTALVRLRTGGAGRRLARAVLAVEAAAVVLLAVPPLRGIGLLLAGALLAAFTGVVARAVGSRTAVSCHCFGTSAVPVGAPQLVRNGLLLMVTALAVPGVLHPAPLPWQAWFAVWLTGAVAALVLVVGDELVLLLRARPAARIRPGM